MAVKVKCGEMDWVFLPHLVNFWGENLDVILGKLDLHPAIIVPNEVLM